MLGRERTWAGWLSGREEEGQAGGQGEDRGAARGSVSSGVWWQEMYGRLKVKTFTFVPWINCNLCCAITLQLLLDNGPRRYRN